MIRIELTAPVRTKRGDIGLAWGRAHMPGGDVYDVRFVGRYTERIERFHISLLEQIGEPRPDLIRIMPLSPAEEVQHARCA